MASHIFMQPFAEALFDIGQEQNILKDFEDNFEGFLQAVKDVAEFKSFLFAPNIREDLKKEVMDKLFKDKIHPMFRNFLFIMLEKNVMPFIQSCYDYFKLMLDKHYKRMRIELTTAIEIDQATEEKILNKVKGLLKVDTLFVDKKVKPEILGGFVVKSPDTIINVSLARELSEIRRNIILNKRVA